MELGVEDKGEEEGEAKNWNKREQDQWGGRDQRDAGKERNRKQKLTMNIVTI